MKKQGVTAIAGMLLFGIVVVTVSCSKNADSTNSTVTKHWDVVLNSKFEVPAPASRTETGTATLDLYSNNTLKYTLSVTGLAAGDQLTAGHIHTGDPLTSGPVIIPFNPTFTGSSATGTVTIRQSLADSLTNNSTDFYVNIHSTQQPSGLLRGQLVNPVTFAQDVALSGSNEVPAVNTTASGTALFRQTADKSLYTKYTITGLESGDTVTAAHVHTGASGTNGPVIIPVAASAADFGKVIKITGISDANIALLLTGSVYANAHSKNHPSGLVRGQIR